MISNEELSFKIQVSQMGIGKQFSVCEMRCLLFSLNSNCAFLNLCSIKIEKKRKEKNQMNSSQAVGVFSIAVVVYQNAKY